LSTFRHFVPPPSDDTPLRTADRKPDLNSPEDASYSVDTDASWWRQASVYQIYPRSFFDSDGDGLGDVRGITAKVPYLKELGIDAVWVSPFYPSALADGGYDVDDYRNVDPRLGTLTDFDELAAALQTAGMRIVVDIVPNHSSDRHEWFQEALAAPSLRSSRTSTGTTRRFARIS
jgi:alpha-glucosidase